jgi:serine phosphatase RsbU (regulator of sigma subunit)
MAGPTAVATAVPIPDPPEDLREVFRQQLVAGRWLLLIAAVAVSLLLFLSGELSSLALRTLGLFFVYGVITPILVQRWQLSRLPVRALLALDMLWIALAAYYTGGASSPFLGLYYLTILAAALLYNLPGGLVVGITATLFAVLVGHLQHTGSGLEFWLDLRNLAFYYVLVGGFTGFLVGRSKDWMRRFQESQAHLLARKVRDESERRELELARKFQEAALPTTAPQVPGMEIAVRMEYAGEVGGDFYLYLPGQERFGLVVGDVSGKGISAALLSTTIAYLLPGFFPLADPTQALLSLNAALRERLPPHAFVTLVLAIIDQAAGKLYLWSAGHPPALLWDASEGSVREAQVYNPVLGILPAVQCHPEEWSLETGDVLVLFSDGLVEVQNAERDLFRSSRAADVLASNAGRAAGEIADALVEAGKAWGPLSDDLTLVVCKRLSCSETPLHASEIRSFANGSAPSHQTDIVPIQ